MKTTRLLSLFCMFGYVFTKTPPDVDCLVLHLKYVACSWTQNGTPDVNYTFYSRFNNVEAESECATYLTDNNVITGCKQPYKKRDRFYKFFTTLEHGNHRFVKNHWLKSKVRLNPPTNLTVVYGSDLNLWYYWSQTNRECVQSEVRYQINNNNNWKLYTVSIDRQSYCINLPSRRQQYILQVRSKIGKPCGESQFWSDWSEPVVWGSNNSTDSLQMNDLSAVWMPVLYVLGPIVFILLMIMLVQHERLRVILIPVVPKPWLIPNEDWFKISEGLKEGFKTNYNERAWPVCEYFPVSRSNSVASSFTIDQTDRLVSMSEKEPQDASSSGYSSASTASYADNEQHVSVVEESAAFVES